ncbi:hypothetical protein MY11210_006828 [Beauveria gryllotalpidicola]
MFPGSGRRQSATTYSNLAPRRGSVPLERCAAAASRYVDLLDAQGQLGPSDFKARLQASGSREYGEDVAERNIGQNGLLLGSPAVQQFYAAQSSQTSPRRPTSRYRRYAQKQVILEQPEMKAALRPSSRASSVCSARSLPIPRTRVTRIFDSPICTEPRRASLASHYTPSLSSSMGLPQLQEGSIREEMDTEASDDAAFPPSIPRFRRSEADTNAQQRPASALGWVRRARESVDVLSAYDMGEPIRKESVDHAFQDDAASRRPATRNRKNSPAAQQQNLSVENMIRWRRTFGEADEEDQTSVATERATESRTSQRQWSIASTEPTERSDVSSVYCPRPASRATANTSVDLGSLMELDDGCCCKASHDVVNDDVDACSITTDGSNIDAFVKKRKQRAMPEDQALLFKEGGFFHTGGSLPGLYDPSSSSSAAAAAAGAAAPAEQVSPAALSDSKRDSSQTLRADAPTTHKTARAVSPGSGGGGCSATTESALEDGRCSSKATPEPVTGLTVPQIYLSQRQRLLALGFDYDTDEDGDLGVDDDNDDDDTKTLRQRDGSAPTPPRPSIIVDAPPKDMFDSYSSSSSSGYDSAAAAALRRRREAKRLSRCGGGARVMRVPRSLRDEFDGNVADVE